MVQKKNVLHSVSVLVLGLYVFFLTSGVQTKSEKPNGGARDVHVFAECEFWRVRPVT